MLCIPGPVGPQPVRGQVPAGPPAPNAPLIVQIPHPDDDGYRGDVGAMRLSDAKDDAIRLAIAYRNSHLLDKGWEVTAIIARNDVHFAADRQVRACIGNPDVAVRAIT